jgi:hypothetical protein
MLAVMRWTMADSQMPPGWQPLWPSSAGIQLLVPVSSTPHPVSQQVAGMLLDGQVGGVGDVEAVLLGPLDQRVLQAEEVA